MSEGTDSSVPSGETEQLEPKGKPNKRKLLLPIIAVIVVILLIGTALVVVFMNPKHTLAVTVSPANVTVDAGKMTEISASALFDDEALAEDAILDNPDSKISWTLSPLSLGRLDRTGGKLVIHLTAGKVGVSGTITCEILHEKVESSGIANVTVNPPVFDSVAISPSSKNVPLGGYQIFTATAINSVSDPMTGASFTWSFTGMADTDYNLNSTAGKSVNFSATAKGSGILNVTGTVSSVSKYANALVDVGLEVNRTVYTRWYDMFNVPFGSWWDRRWVMTGVEEPVTQDYPYIYKWHGAPLGNVYYYSEIRQNITGRNLTEVSMNENPEFLPFLGTQRGGNAVLDWRLEYMTHDDVVARFPPSIATWDDGWYLRTYGTTTLDKQGAKAVLNLTDAGYDDFAAWWAVNNKSTEYQEWLKTEGNERLDIFNMYDYSLAFNDWNFWAAKEGDSIVLHWDFVTWGMEALLTRWMVDAGITPNEWYYEDVDFHMSITPYYADFDFDAASQYGVYLYETTVTPPGKTHGDPCWVWEALMQDYLDQPGHPSLFKPYKNFKYLNTAPGSEWYGKNMSYDYTPGAYNLSENETMTFEWPAGEQLFIVQSFDAGDNAIIGETYNVSANMTIEYSEPMESDNPELAPGQVIIDNANRLMTFIGPIDMYNWSKTQTEHAWLLNEWGRMGMLPYGAPYIEWAMETVVPPVLDHFEVSGVTDPIIVGATSDVTVKAIDQYGNVFTAYGGEISFSSTDAGATLPADFTFQVSDAGTHTFVDGVSFSAQGTQTVTVADTADPLKFGELDVVVSEAPKADHFVFSITATEVVVNSTQAFTLTVYDQYNQVFPTYEGTVNFTANRTATLPVDYRFTLADAGTHAFDTNLSLHEVGFCNVTATDVADSNITGWVSIEVVGEPSRIDHFNVYMEETELTPGTGYDITVEAISQYGTVFVSYNGTVSFSTNATGTTNLPANYVFVPGDNGNKTFAGAVSFSDAGVWRIDVADVYNVTATGSITGITVYAWPEITYKLYDMFEPEFEEWFWTTENYGRLTWYYQDYILSNETHKHAWLYAPDQGAAIPTHTVIFALYRWQIDARNMTTLNVHQPEFTFINQTIGPQAGSEVKMKMHMQYIDWTEWTTYWIPEWGWIDVDHPYNETAAMMTWYTGQADGYQLGMLYNITMNREAAYEWIGMPVTADVATWYDNGNNLDFLFFQFDWMNWIFYEGNTRLDIFCGYDDAFYYGFNWMKVQEIQATGEVVFTIAEVDWGYEVLLTRWLTEVNLSPHEPYYEDLTMYANYSATMADVFIDAVGSYSFRSVRQNQSATNEGAWAWEPTKIDYVSSTSDTKPHPPSPFDNYVDLTYISLNSGDELFGQPVGYDATPWWMNLSAHQKLIIQLPTSTDVLGFFGQGVPSGTFTSVQSGGSLAPYTALMYNGTMSLGHFETGGVDLAPMYNPATKTLTIVGPVNFDYPRNATSELLYHGAPWIEFDVSTTMGSLSLPAPAEAPAPAASSTGSVAAGSASLVAVVLVTTLAIAAVGGLLRRRL
jgi:cytoskeletal protein RodZ